MHVCMYLSHVSYGELKLTASCWEPIHIQQSTMLCIRIYTYHTILTCNNYYYNMGGFDMQLFPRAISPGDKVY